MAASEEDAGMLESLSIELDDSEIESSFLRVSQAERMLGRYELFYELGRGGMATVFLARMRGAGGFQRWFAIKRVHENLAGDREFIDMFLDEARIAAAVQHPNVAQVFDLGEADGRYYIAMEYLHGEPLHRVVGRAGSDGKTLRPELVAHIGARAAEGLHHAHEATNERGEPLHLVHRDVSPHNVVITYGGQIKLTDFGVAKAGGRLTQTTTGTVKGKLAYCSPEQLHGHPIDRRADVFAMGVVLWEVATGRRLFKGASDAETVKRIATGYWNSPRAFVPGFPEELEQIIQKALAPKPEERYQTAAELARDLDRFVIRQGERFGATDVAKTMAALFPREIAEKDTILHTGSIPKSIDMPRSSSPSKPLLTRTADVHQPSLAQPAPSQPLTVDNRRRWVLPFAIVSVLAIAAVGWFVLRPSLSEVSVASTPSGAIVRIDGRPQTGTTPLVVTEVERGTHRIELVLEGYEPLDLTFQASADAIALNYALVRVQENGPAEVGSVDPPEGEAGEPLVVGMESSESVGDSASEPSQERRPRTNQARGTATLRFVVARPQADLWVNGRHVGQTPQQGIEVPAGRVRLRYRRTDGLGQEVRRTLRATAGQDLNVPLVVIPES
ncbi:MAG: serine/threonine-protein kinase [Myxococcota bacterium]